MKRIAVLISNKGTGSNLGAILEAIEKGLIRNAKVVVVVSDKKDAYGLKRAKEKSIPVEIEDLREHLAKGATRSNYNKTLGKLLKDKYNPDLIVLAGWMLILSKEFIEYFPDKIINLHPGLLPDNGEYITLASGSNIKAIRGLHTNAAVKYAIEHNYPATGSTVHFITPIVDEGPVIIRGEVDIKKGDTVESLYKRIKSVEHKILPQAIELICSDKLEISNGKVLIQ